MNALSINNDPVQGIAIEYSRLTLPSGECTLSFSVHINDGTPVVNKKVGLAFINSMTHKVVDLPLVQDDKSHWGGNAVLPADASGQAQFSLKVPVPLPENLKLQAMLQDEPAYQDGKNTLTFCLTEHIIDHTSEVDKLEIVSGTPQWTQLPDRKPYADLIVKATHGGAPVGSARVTLAVTDDPGKTRTTVPSGPVFTSGGGLARITPVVGTSKGQLTITASCNGHSVDFHLVVLPARGDLMLVSPILPAIIPAKATTPVPVKVRLISKSDQREFWPGIPCRFIHTQNPINGLVAENTPAPDARITSDQRGDLPPFNVHFASLRSGVPRGSIDYLAYLPGDDTTPASVTISLSVR